MSSQFVVNNLCKTYVVNKRQNNILRNVSFTMKEGEMVAVMGPSGSGKSTLLYTVSGMDRVSAGSVNFFGKEISNLSDQEASNVRLSEMGFVFQQMHMLKNLSIYDNIILPAYQLQKESKVREDIKEYAVFLMHKLGITEVSDNDIHEVSGGQLQRACICRSLINKPRVLFADEPTGALNHQASKEVMDILNQINEEGTTIMIVTHDRKVAARCERILYIEDGSIQDELLLGSCKLDDNQREREQKLSGWLMDLGW